MKILFDMSRFGSFLSEERRYVDGVIKTTNMVANGLDKYNGCDLRYTCMGDFHALYQGKKNFMSHADFPSWSWHCSKLSYFTYATWRKIAFREARKKTRLYLLWKIAALKMLNKMSKSFDTISSRDIQWADFVYMPLTNYPVKEKILRSNKPVIATSHDMLPILYPEYLSKEVVYNFVQSVQSLKDNGWFICISESARKDLCEFGEVDPARTTVIYWGIEKGMFYPSSEESIIFVRKKYGIPDGPYLLSVARIEERKNIKHLVRCYRKLRAEGKIDNMSLVLAGGHADILLDGMLDELKHEGIILLPSIDKDDLAPLYSGATTFVFPSIYEGFGLPPLEAMQCGVPVIASNKSSIPEIVGDAGILLDPHDIDGWCQAIIDMYRGRCDRKKLIKAGFERVKQFSWDKTIEQMVDFFRTVV